MTNVILIFLLQILYVPVMTLRITFVVKGKKSLASFVSFIEAIIYIVSLGIVFSDLTNLYNIFSYVIGYSVGIYFGCMVEEKLAIGYRSVHINLMEDSTMLADKLREKGFGATMFTGSGRNGEPRYRLEVISHRNREQELIAFIKEQYPTAFIVSYEPTQFKGGYLTKQMKRGLKLGERNVS